MKRKTLISLGLAVLTFVLVLIPCVYGWATNFYVRDIIVDAGVIGGYFAGGNGTEERPYEIANKRHLYNLAWLQYMGNFNHKSSTNEEEYETYYFKLSNDLDCEGMVLPPIGTSDNPFISVFDGGGYTISNLKVSNNYNELEQHPNNVNVTNYQGVNIIGFFGIVGKYTGTENNGLTIPVVADGQGGTSVITDVHDFYLDNLEINSNKANSLVGLLAGYVSGNVSNIGIHYSWFNMASSVTNIDQKKVSNYALIGDYNINGEGGIDWVDKPEGGAIGYGTSTDIKELKDKMQALNGTSGTPAINASQYLPFSGTGEIITEGGTNIGEVADENNIGYYTGSDIKIYEKNKSEIDSTHFYYPSGESNGIWTLPHTGYDNTTYPDADEDVKKATINSDDTKIYTIRLQNKIDINNNLTTIYNAKLWGEDIPVLKIPRRVVWVKPKQPGTMKFVMINTKDGENFTLSRFYRSVRGDYSSSMTGLETIIDTNNLGMLTYGKKGADIRVDGQQVAFNDVALAYYFTCEITEEDIAAGYEYALSRDNGSNGAYFWYLDVGANGGNVDPTYIGTIEGVDFVYTVGNGYNSFDDKSEVLFGIDNVSSDVLVYFKRNDQMVLYFVTSEGVDVTPIGSGSSKKATDKNCNS
ncbi:MAG: hypothetical protein K2G50_03885, partial [Anaeroplasmataceae bacterium]|nr:hypothetical protein [Anaeroplasmataceae bacterium]